MTTAALYARVSSEKQVQENTIASQIEALKARITTDGFILLEEDKFIDNGYSGSNLIRPALEKLRDQVAAGRIDKIYIHSPDRLSRKYSYQMILIEEFEKSGVEVIFLNFQAENNPEANLLLQMQGMISEYEREKIMERHRRGKIHTAKRGSVNALSVAGYGYKYIDRHTNGGEASFEVVEEEAEVIRKIFNWVGKERLTIGEISKRLQQEQIPTKTGKTHWDRSTICYMLKNPAYKGQAAFGRKKIGVRLPCIRPRKDSSEQPKKNCSRYAVERERWIHIPVPAIIDENLFEMVQEQIEENKKRARKYPQGATYLLQGLLVCNQCHRAYCGGKSIRHNKNDDTIYFYYRCTGTDSYRFGGNKMCDSKQVNANAIEQVVWEEVKKLISNPQRIFDEYQQRLQESKQTPLDHTYASIDKQRIKLEKIIELLIDSYTHQYIMKNEFEPRIKSIRQKLDVVREQQQKLVKQENLTKELELIVSNLEEFSSRIISRIDNLDWNGKREIIRGVVKRIEMEGNKIDIVYRVNQLPDNRNINTQHCSSRTKELLCKLGRIIMQLCQQQQPFIRGRMRPPCTFTEILRLSMEQCSLVMEIGAMCI